ncbi:unnamed protein product [Camellia sinensis]
MMISKHLVLSLLASLRLPSGEKLVRIFGCGHISKQQATEIRSIMNQLRNGNANGSQGEPNASANESMGSSAVTMPVNVV